MEGLFLIAIGGTGMRCLESFVHLCAIGMFDNRTINILTLDTDSSNGNKERVEQLIGKYNAIKREDDDPEGHSNSDTFFSAKLKLFKFFTSYNQQTGRTYQELTRTATNNDDEKSKNNDLSALFMDENMQTFNLEHGYRAQTHLGSLLMYHSIVNSARESQRNRENMLQQDKDLKTFIELLLEKQDHARLFVLGSIFGGTGASSIPIIPVALQEAAKIISGGKELREGVLKFGSTLLTEYFSFGNGDMNQRSSEKVVASSNNFAINCQAAIQYYITDPTVSRNYSRFYNIGWPIAKKKVDKQGAQVETGGKNQKNDCHVIELFCACAAYDFLTSQSVDFNNKEAIHYARAIEIGEDGKLNLTGSDFIATTDSRNRNVFESKLGAMFSLAHLVLGRIGSAWNKEVGTTNLNDLFIQQKIDEYKTITTEQFKAIDEYLRDFAYSFDTNGNIKNGWLYQIKNSIEGNFIFNESVAFKTSKDDLKEVWCGQLFNEKEKNWSEMKGGFLSHKEDNSSDALVTRMAKYKPLPRQNAKTLKERFMANIYNAITNTEV